MPAEVVQTPFGKFLIDPEDLIGSTLKAGTLWDGPGFLQPIALQYGRLGEPGVTILDVGANQGAFSVWLASRGAWRVLAFEPVPETMLRLKANLDLNREVTADRVIPIEVAGYDRPIDLTLQRTYDRRNTGGMELRRLESNEVADRPIRGVPLDEYAWLAGAVSLIKIDTQGCDGAVLHGLSEILNRDHPTVVFEWEDTDAVHGYTLKATKDFLSQFGYWTHAWPSQPNNFLATVIR